MNFVKGALTADGLAIGAAQVLPLAARLTQTANGKPEVTVGLRPEAFLATPIAAGTGTTNGSLRGEVDFIEQLGSEAFAYLRIEGVEVLETSERSAELAGTLCARLDPRARLSPGDPVALSVEPELVRLFDPETGASLVAFD
jgi:multiple sugar transport system ATP-binding protein